MTPCSKLPVWKEKLAVSYLKAVSNPMIYFKIFLAYIKAIILKILYSKDRKHLHLQAYFHLYKLSLKDCPLSING